MALSFRQAQVWTDEEGRTYYPDCSSEIAWCSQAANESAERKYEFARASEDRMQVGQQVEQMQQLLHQVHQLQEQTQAELSSRLSSIDGKIDEATSRLERAQQEIGGYLSTTTSAMGAMTTAGAKGLASPSKVAEVGAALLNTAPGTDGVVAQGLQVAGNMAVAGAGEFMDATIRQHGESPAVTLNNQQIRIQIHQDSQLEE